jgi:hypothetical protein
MNYQHHSVSPDVQQISWTEHDQPVFTLSFENNAIRLGDIYLKGILVVKKGARLNDGVDHQILYDSLVGAHGVIQDLYVSSQQQGEIESCSNYPRLVKQRNSLSTGQTNCFSTQSAMELRTAEEQHTRFVLRGFGRPAGGNNEEIVQDPDFIIKPSICLNSTSQMLNYSHSGDVKLTFNLARAVSFLHGASNDNTVTYEIENLQLVYMTLPETGKQQPINMIAHLSFNSLVDSNSAVIKTRPRGVCVGYSASCIQNNQVDQYNYNNTRLAPIPQLGDVTFLFNDSLSQSYKFQLRGAEREEILKRYVESMGSSLTSVSPKKIDTGDSFGFGMAFDQPIDLTNQSFTVQLNSGITNLDRYRVYSFFRQLVKL